MDKELPAHTFNEARYYLMVTACEHCGKGPWEIDSSEPSPQDKHLIAVEAHCGHCGQEQAFRFLCESELLSECAEVEQINITNNPSIIVDVAQWLSLFYMLLESASSTDDKIASRRTGFRATLCLCEALKFYTDDELPDESAFFTSKSLAVFRGHPENFARQKLRDMQAKLPTLPRMARSVSRDERSSRKHWWKFWK